MNYFYLCHAPKVAKISKATATVVDTKDLFENNKKMAAKVATKGQGILKGEVSLYC